MRLLTFLLPWIAVMANVVITSVIGVLSKHMMSTISAQKKQLKDEEERQASIAKAQNDAILALLRDRLFHACFASLHKGSLTAEEHENLLEMHKAYKVLHGDGTADRLVEQVIALPITDGRDIE